MCKLKSGIVLRDRIFLPDYASHTDMLDELGIEDNYLNATKTFVRFEYSPLDNDVFTPVSEWHLRIDQDIIPDWFDEEKYLPRIVEAVEKWAETHIHIGVDNLKINSGENHYIKDCKNVEIYDSATVKNICGSATVKNAKGFAVISSARFTNWKNKSGLILAENATFRDCLTKTIYQSGDWKLCKYEGEIK